MIIKPKLRARNIAKNVIHLPVNYSKTLRSQHIVYVVNNINVELSNNFFYAVCDICFLVSFTNRCVRLGPSPPLGLNHRSHTTNSLRTRYLLFFSSATLSHIYNLFHVNCGKGTTPLRQCGRSTAVRSLILGKQERGRQFLLGSCS